MPAYHIHKSFDRHTKLTEKSTAVMRMFGLTKNRLDRIRFKCDFKIEINPGDIVYITGPSGTGKTVILRELQRMMKNQNPVDLATIKIPKENPVVDCIDAGLTETLRYFCTAGLGDCPSLLNTPGNLSEGQQWRFRLAVALSAKSGIVFADEFGSLLDRVTASCISSQLRKFADRHNVTFILASAHNDTLMDLLPDVIVKRDFSNGTDVTYKKA
jgi:hypothetical protein